MTRRHTYEVSVAWTGNRGTGTSGYRAYGRDMVGAAMRLHEDASARCFIARSVNFPVRHEPVVTAEVSRTGPYTARHQGHRSDS